MDKEKLLQSMTAILHALLAIKSADYFDVIETLVSLVMQASDEDISAAWEHHKEESS